MTEMVEDLAAWLTAVWDEEERQFEAACEAEAEYLRSDGLPDETAASVREFWLSPEAGTEWPLRLARIAADRKILARCMAIWSEHEEGGPLNGLVRAVDAGLIVHDLASPYESRPDFRPEWLVERQGVEG
jgi:hypothetical protein